MKIIIEEFKEKVAAITESFKQNIFQNCQTQFYKELNQEGERCENEKPHNEKKNKKKFGGVFGISQQSIRRTLHGEKICHKTFMSENRENR